MTLKISVISGSGEADTELIEEQIQGLDYELEKFECASDGETIEAMAGADIVINAGVPISREVIEETEGVQAIMVGSHGFNHIDHEAATEQGIMVVNSAGFCTEEVSNHAILLLLACAKKLAQLNDLVKAGKWGAETRAAIMPMVPIYDQTLGLVAFGNIARATARKAQAFGMEVIAYDPYCPPWIAREYRVKLVGSLEELAAESDFVSVHTPLNNETQGLLSESFFKAMKPTAYIVNTCRGPVIDEAAIDRRAPERRDRRRRPRRVRGRADPGRQPAAKDGQRRGVAALGWHIQHVKDHVRRPGRPGDLTAAERHVPDVRGQPGSAARHRRPPSCDQRVAERVSESR